MVTTDEIVKKLKEATETLGLGELEFRTGMGQPWILSMFLPILHGTDVQVSFDRKEILEVGGPKDLLFLVRDRIKHRLTILVCAADELDKKLG